ncbi:MAG: LysR family transcriptional regulator [Pseudomonadota bacterium]
MIDFLRHMAVFARVVDEGSFRGAARDLNMAPSRVSEIVSDLETRLAVTLLYRSTRKIALTSEGRMLYARVVEMLRNAELGLNELNALTLEPAGALKISMPAFMSTSPLSRAIGEFVSEHPRVTLSINYTDRPVRLVEDGFDMNIRVGWLADSALMSRKLGEEGRMLVAGKEYAAAKPKPRRPSDLEGWDWIRYAQRADTIEFTSANGTKASVKGHSQVRVDSIEAMYEFTVQNLGATVLPYHLGKRGVGNGDFVELLPKWKLRPLGFYAVWADKSRRESLTLHLVRHLAGSKQMSASKL